MNSSLHMRVQRSARIQALPNVDSTIVSYIPITNVLICSNSSNSIKDFAYCVSEPPDIDIETPTIYASKRELLYESIYANKEMEMRFLNWRLRFGVLRRRRLKKSGCM